ncbi:hypothetical protein DFS34DRAFT_622968 [Phlyctochytrium arcticum]|nr:hypothetical protein DFS34DRAFT_637737 [Phlyctochytrium arcticum]KAI9095492.1 hypothetical protein DFS34DRAFT_625972 [Phlyctochytrium arcticum]KAI9096489.1 hypothetical protein DFS34DRAFT_622968 [Phlyctochytrium arcticum]
MLVLHGSYEEKFKQALVYHSVASEYEEALNEWMILDVACERGLTKCICTHPISEICRIQNHETDKVLIVGNCCVHKCMTCLICHIRFDKSQPGEICLHCKKCNNQCSRCKKYFGVTAATQWKKMCTPCWQILNNIPVTQVTTPDLYSRRKTKPCPTQKCRGTIKKEETWKTHCKICYMENLYNSS